MRYLSKNAQKAVTISVLAIVLSGVIIPSVTYVYGSIIELKLADAVQQTKLETMGERIEDLWRLFRLDKRDGTNDK